MTRAAPVLLLALLAAAVLGRAQDLVLAPTMVVIPSGAVRIGSADEDIELARQLCVEESRLDRGEGCTLERFALELAPRAHHVAAFGLDRTEVTVGEYAACVARGWCAPAEDPSGRAEVRAPVTGVDAARAETYCRARGGRLPTEREWARAAHGDDARTFPWGAHYDPGRTNHGRPPNLSDEADGFAGAAPVGSYPSGASPFGVLDLAGNVWEWTASAPRADDVSLFGPINPAGYRVLRGGSFLSPGYAVRAATRNIAAIDLVSRDLGFRCAYDLR